MDVPLTVPLLADRAGPAISPTSKWFSRQAGPRAAPDHLGLGGSRRARAPGRPRLLNAGDAKKAISRRDADVEPRAAPGDVLRRAARRAAWCTRSTCASRPDDLAYIATHAQDRFLVLDDVLLPLLDKFPRACAVREDHRGPAHPGARRPAGCIDYETFVSSGRRTVRSARAGRAGFPAGLCYTSGTTGQAEGRRVHAQVDGAAHHVSCPSPTGSPCATRTRSCPSSPCSTSTPGACLTAAP